MVGSKAEKKLLWPKILYSEVQSYAHSPSLFHINVFLELDGKRYEVDQDITLVLKEVGKQPHPQVPIVFSKAE